MKLTKIKIFLLPIVLIFTSCKVYHLDIEDNQWQPYKEGDVLVFQNSNGTSDTVNVTSSQVLSQKTVSPYDIGNSKNEINISFGNKDEKEIGLIRISKNKKGTYLGLSEYTLFTQFGIDIPIKDLSRFSNTDEKWGESYLINNFEKYRYGEDSKIKSILYSKKWGYLKFNLINGESYELKEFIRGGKNLL